MSDAFEALFARARGAFAERSVFDLARTLALASIVSLGRHTIAGTLATCGRQFQDWTAAYRVFERSRFDSAALFEVSRRSVAQALEPGAPLAVVLDDSLLPRCGRKVAEAGWHHDPQSPPFNHQIKWSQRFLQVSAMLPSKPKEQCGAARAIPIGQALLKVVKKPRIKTFKKDPALGEKENERRLAAHIADREQEFAGYRERRKSSAAPKVGAERVAALRASMNESGDKERALHVAVDGGYTNKALFKNIPANTAIVGRLRKDATLYAVPEAPPPGRGRPRLYGEVLAKPQEVLADPNTKWKTATIFAAGKLRPFEYTTIDRCRWKSSGARNVRVFVIKPLSATPHAAGLSLFFANPGYLICSEPSLPDELVLQEYIWRWEIEVGFREQKTEFGLGQAQTYTQPAVAAVLDFQAFCYGLLLLAAHQTEIAAPPLPLWRKQPKSNTRVSCGQLISTMRADLWGRALGLQNKMQFAGRAGQNTKTPKIENTLDSAVIYARQ